MKKISGLSCSKLRMSSVNVSLKLWSLNMAYMLYFCWKNVSSFCICKSYSHFFSKNICELDISLTRTVNILTTNELVKLTMLWTTGPSSFQLIKSALPGAVLARTQLKRRNCCNSPRLLLKLYSSKEQVWKWFSEFQAWDMAPTVMRIMIEEKVKEVTASLHQSQSQTVTWKRESERRDQHLKRNRDAD